MSAQFTIWGQVPLSRISLFFGGKTPPKLVASTMHVKLVNLTTESYWNLDCWIFFFCCYFQAAYSDHFASIWTKVAEDTKGYANRSWSRMYIYRWNWAVIVQHEHGLRHWESFWWPSRLYMRTRSLFPFPKGRISKDFFGDLYPRIASCVTCVPENSQET